MLILGIALGAALGYVVARSRAARRRPGEPVPGAPAIGREDLARAWQQGYDAGAAAARGAQPTPPVPAGPHPAPPSPAPAPLPPPPAPVLVSRPQPQPQPEPQSHLQPQPPRPTAEELAAEKERRDRRNVNITLYTACLLLVAAASLFIGAALPVTARVSGLAVVVGLFYAGGLVVHVVSRTLRPAAVAFTGTGLALVPVLGVALDVLVLDDPARSWLITSVLGTVLFAVAAVRLDSAVVAYLTVPFLLSTVMASGAVVQRGMAWALIAWIGLAVLMAWLSADPGAAATRRDRRLPGPYRTAIARTHQWITPGAVLAAVTVGLWVEPVQMFLLLLAATAYYATVAVIGPRRFRLASCYAVRAGFLLALAAWAAMLDWPLPVTLTALVTGLCLQVPLTWFGRGHGGFLPAGPAGHGDRVGVLVAAWILTAAVQAGALFDAEGPWLVEGFSWALAVLVLTTAVLAVASVRATSDLAAGLGWQAATPLSLVPAVLGLAAVAGDGPGPWLGEACLGVVIVVQLVITAALRRGADRAARWDGLVAPHGAALAAVALVYLLAERWVPPAGWDPSVVAGLAALAWGTATALVQRPATGGVPAVIPPLAWSVASVLSLALLGSADAVAGWYTVLVVTGGLGLWWLAGRPSGAGERIAVLAVTGTVLTGTLILLAGAAWAWHADIALTALTAWLVAAAVLTRDRLPRAVRASLLLLGQAGSAVLVADVVGHLGGDGSAVRSAAAVTLLTGLAVRSRLAGRLEGLGSGIAPSWVVTAALGVLWLLEVTVGADRAALMIIAASVIGAGLVLRTDRGGHWAVLAGALALVLPASPVLRLEGGWLPDPLVPASVASALLVILALAVAGWEIAASVAGTRESPGRGVADLDAFRPVALGVLWLAAVLVGSVAGPDRGPHPGVLGITAATAALVCYLLARTRGIPALVTGTVVAVPVSAVLLLQWWRDRGLWAPDEAWQLPVVAVLSAGVLGLWARLDAAALAPGAGERLPRAARFRPAALWQGGLAVALVLATVSLLRTPLHAGLPEDAVVWVSCALLTGACWLAVDAGGRTLLWRGPPSQDAARASWVLNGRDVAVLVSYAAAARAWWQTADPEHSGRALWWTVQVLVVLLVALGLWHGYGRHGHRSGAGPRPERRLAFHVAAAAVFTLAAFTVPAEGTSLMQLVVLAGFGALVVLGLVQRLQVLAWWGAAGVALSVLWYLREYTYVYLALLGAALIVLAVWQLRRRGRGRDAERGYADR